MELEPLTVMFEGAFEELSKVCGEPQYSVTEIREALHPLPGFGDKQHEIVFRPKGRLEYSYFLLEANVFALAQSRGYLPPGTPIP